MDSSLPTSLKVIISNAEYYGPVLFMAGMDMLGYCKSKIGRSQVVKFKVPHPKALHKLQQPGKFAT